MRAHGNSKALVGLLEQSRRVLSSLGDESVVGLVVKVLHSLQGTNDETNRVELFARLGNVVFVDSVGLSHKVVGKLVQLALIGFNGGLNVQVQRGQLHAALAGFDSELAVSFECANGGADVPSLRDGLER